MAWEYYNCHVISPGIEPDSHSAHMKQLGDDGWEMCGCSFDANKGIYRMFFKRPKQLTKPQGVYR
jgi:hypothetical protein